MEPSSTSVSHLRGAPERADDQLGFYIHFAVYLLVNALLIGLNIRCKVPEGIGIRFTGIPD